MSFRTFFGEMRSFVLIWAGQLVSVLGSSLTSFALGVWVYQRTGSATKFALVAFFATLPGIIVSPLAGAVADRWDRRSVMILCDFGSGLCVFAVAVLLYFNGLEIWHIYVINGVKSIFITSQGPAYIAATTLLVPKRHLGRASGMIQLNDAVGQIIAPVLAVGLITAIHLWGVIFIDFFTFLFAAAVLLSTPVPKLLSTSSDGKERRPSLMRSAAYGWSYITTRPGLLGLLIFFAVNNFLIGFVIVLSTPLMLSFATPRALATALSFGGFGLLVGSISMSAWGGPKRRVKGVVGFYLLVGLCIVVMGSQPSVPLITVAVFFLFLGLPVIIGSSQAIWQSKVALDVQGRVFAVRRMIAWASMPLAYLVAGPLADHVFEPLLAVNGPLAGSVGRLIGVGRGRGIGLLYIVLGVFVLLAAAVAWLYPRLRLIEDELPDVIADHTVVKAL